MIKIGITGGIGSGKTVVSRLLEVMNIPVYYADTEAKRLTESSPLIKEKLTALFGKEIYKNGFLNKALLASLIFNDKEALSQTNTIIHPEVATDFERWATEQNSPVVAIEAAILFESGFDKKTDLVITVSAPLPLRLFRIMQRDGLSEARILERMGNQLPEEEKIRKADFVILNDEKQSVIQQTLLFLNKIS
ncbi:MAG: dephospho-CoA kinase [Candidatus Azobacteroides sp.]|nr:dephospho-CoA kinase [Candidatus Azobacteroides sp.]